MKRRNLVIACILTAFAANSATSIAIAEPSCTEWMDQGDGTSWKECVNDDGSQHCYKISNAQGSTSYEVSCSS